MPEISYQASMHLLYGPDSRIEWIPAKSVQEWHLIRQWAKIRVSIVNNITFTYLPAKKNGTLYTGITKDLLFRVQQHKNDLVEGFARKYQVHRLVYFEVLENPYDAILREKRIKKWKREWKISLIEKDNPAWKDLYEDFLWCYSRKPSISFPREAGMIFELNGLRNPTTLDARLRGHDKKGVFLDFW